MSNLPADIEHAGLSAIDIAVRSSAVVVQPAPTAAGVSA